MEDCPRRVYSEVEDCPRRVYSEVEDCPRRVYSEVKIVLGVYTVRWKIVLDVIQ